MKTKTQKNKFIFAVSALLIALLSLNVAQAEEGVNTSSTTQSNVSAKPAVKNWKAEWSSYFYDFEGTKTASNDLYTFGNSTLALQLFSLQYQYSPKLTIMVLGQYLDNFVETKMFGNIYYDRVKGMGDTFVSAITPIYLGSSLMVFGDAGVSLPTGSIDKKNAYNPNSNYAYNMQLGSGTTDGVFGVTALHINGSTVAGSHLAAILRDAKNKNGYHLGNQYRADAWVDYNTAIGLTPRLVGYYKNKEAITGEDSTLARQALTEFYYHQQINWDVSAALKYEKPVGAVALSAEVGRPLLQDSKNFDDAVVSTEYYGNVKVSGAF